jgi:hypothetical protein
LFLPRKSHPLSFRHFSARYRPLFRRCTCKNKCLFHMETQRKRGPPPPKIFSNPSLSLCTQYPFDFVSLSPIETHQPKIWHTSSSSMILPPTAT